MALFSLHEYAKILLVLSRAVAYSQNRIINHEKDHEYSLWDNPVSINDSVSSVSNSSALLQHFGTFKLRLLQRAIDLLDYFSLCISSCFAV